MRAYQRKLNGMTVKELKQAIRGTENALEHYQNPDSSLYNPKAIEPTEIQLAAERTTLHCLLRDREEICFNTNYRIEAITIDVINAYWAENDD